MAGEPLAEPIYMPLGAGVKIFSDRWDIFVARAHVFIPMAVRNSASLSTLGQRSSEFGHGSNSRVCSRCRVSRESRAGERGGGSSGAEKLRDGSLNLSARCRGKVVAARPRSLQQRSICIATAGGRRRAWQAKLVRR
jgi:hypothetical protein